MHQERAPQAGIAERSQRKPRAKEDQQRQQHQVAHVARPGRADIDAVIGKGEHAEQRRKDDERQIIARDAAHVHARRHDVDQRRPEQQETGGDREREAKAPHDDELHRAGESILVARAIGAAAELLGGVGEAVEEEAADHQEIVQHGVGRERHVAGTCALRGEEQKRRDQRRGTDHDVAVDREHAHQLGAVEQQRAGSRELPFRKVTRDQQAEQEACGLRDQRRDCSAGNSEVEHQHQHDGRRHVDEVDGDLHAERQFGAGLSDQPAEHDIVAERQWR